METLAIVFVGLTIYLGIVQLATVQAGNLKGAVKTGDIAVVTGLIALVFAILAAGL